MKYLFKQKLLQLLILIAFIASSAGMACSSFVLKNGDRFVLGYNMDLPVDVHLAVMTNTRNIAKQAKIIHDIPAKWTSKYGSITFNFSKEYPFAGMNEKGLVVSALVLENGGKIPEKDERPGVDINLPWVLYQLDNSASVEDVINSDKKIRPTLAEGNSSMHFLVSDKAGNVAVIEFLRGKMVVHSGNELPVPLVTNYKYDSEIKKLVKFLKFGDGDKITALGTEPMNKDNWEKDTLNNGDLRSIMGTYLLKDYQKKLDNPLVEGAFEILKSITNDTNQFAAVFDPINMLIYYKTKKNPEIRKLDFKDFDFITPSMGLMYSMDKDFTDVKKDFEPYTKEADDKLMHEFLASFQQ
jgi:penicillin V acylase-like amidase (Ntn superfamily)